MGQQPRIHGFSQRSMFVGVLLALFIGMILGFGGAIILFAIVFGQMFAAAIIASSWSIALFGVLMVMTVMVPLVCWLCMGESD